VGVNNVNNHSNKMVIKPIIIVYYATGAAHMVIQLYTKYKHTLKS